MKKVISTYYMSEDINLFLKHASWKMQMSASALVEEIVRAYYTASGISIELPNKELKNFLDIHKVRKKENKKKTVRKPRKRKEKQIEDSNQGLDQCKDDWKIPAPIKPVQERINISKPKIPREPENGTVARGNTTVPKVLRGRQRRVFGTEGLLEKDD